METLATFKSRGNVDAGDDPTGGLMMAPDSTKFAKGGITLTPDEFQQYLIVGEPRVETMVDKKTKQTVVTHVWEDKDWKNQVRKPLPPPPPCAPLKRSASVEGSEGLEGLKCKEGSEGSKPTVTDLTTACSQLRIDAKRRYPPSVRSKAAKRRWRKKERKRNRLERKTSGGVGLRMRSPTPDVKSDRKL